MEEVLVVAAGGEEGVEVGGAVGVLAGLGGEAVFQRRELAVAEEVRDVEVDLGDEAFELGFGEVGAGEGGQVGEVGHGEGSTKY